MKQQKSPIYKHPIIISSILTASLIVGWMMILSHQLFFHIKILNCMNNSVILKIAVEWQVWGSSVSAFLMSIKNVLSIQWRASALDRKKQCSQQVSFNIHSHQLYQLFITLTTILEDEAGLLCPIMLLRDIGPKKAGHLQRKICLCSHLNSGDKMIAMTLRRKTIKPGQACSGHASLQH